MPGRRAFMIGCGGIVAAPALALIDLPVAIGEVPRSMPPNAPAQLEMADATTPEALVLRIDGWDLPSGAGLAADGEVWIRINSSWRAAWR